MLKTVAIAVPLLVVLLAGFWFKQLSVAITIVVASVLVGIVSILRRLRGESKQRSACVLVLGDFGRSPRMQYHTLSLATHYDHVDVVAYLGMRQRISELRLL